MPRPHEVSLSPLVMTSVSAFERSYELHHLRIKNPTDQQTKQTNKQNNYNVKLLESNSLATGLHFSFILNYDEDWWTGKQERRE